MRKYIFRKEELENGESRKGASTGKCPVCGIFYFEKRWHSSLPESAKGTQIADLLCPADKMKQDGEYEGSLKINNLPAQYRQEIENLIKHTNEYAMAQDPLHRVLSVEDQNGALVVYTSENQLAQKIAHKIEDAFKQAFKRSQVDRGRTVNTIDVELDWIKTE